MIFASFVDRGGVPIKWMLCLLYVLNACSILFFLVAVRLSAAALPWSSAEASKRSCGACLQVYLPRVFGGTPEHPNYWPVFGACIASGIIGAGTGPLSYELAAEISYPVGEETSATFMSM